MGRGEISGKFPGLVLLASLVCHMCENGLTAFVSGYQKICGMGFEVLRSRSMVASRKYQETTVSHSPIICDTYTKQHKTSSHRKRSLPSGEGTQEKRRQHATKDAHKKSFYFEEQSSPFTAFGAAYMSPKQSAKHAVFQDDDLDAYFDDEDGEDIGTGDNEKEIENTLRQYLAEIGRFPLLTADQELQIARRAANGDKEAHQRLVESNLRLV